MDGAAIAQQVYGPQEIQSLPAFRAALPKATTAPQKRAHDFEMWMAETSMLLQQRAAAVQYQWATNALLAAQKMARSRYRTGGMTTQAMDSYEDSIIRAMTATENEIRVLEQKARIVPLRQVTRLDSVTKSANRKEALTALRNGQTGDILSFDDGKLTGITKNQTAIDEERAAKAKAKVRIATADVQSAEEELARAKRGEGTHTTAQAETKLEEARNRLKQAKKNDQDL